MKSDSWCGVFSPAASTPNIQLFSGGFYKVAVTASDLWVTTLPKALQTPENLARLKQLATQWSRLVAWSWTSCLSFAGDSSKLTQEQGLKTFFIDILKEQGQNVLAFTSYGQVESQKIAEQQSEIIKSLFLGKNDDIPELKDRGIQVTLSDVTEQLTGIPFLNTVEPEFMEQFTPTVVLNQFTGNIIEIGKDRYIAEIAYPPRPALGEATVTQQQLSDWVYNINTQGSYLPPSAFIPIAAS